ncbi:MAG: hypothetical protein SF187_07410 [Deltaproteobacteria bacterium]|nr:hypothetical protein [Deltaproteobacteria bacterium]
MPLSRISALMHTDRPLQDAPKAVPTEVDQKIAELVAALVEDGSTLQVGIGAVHGALCGYEEILQHQVAQDAVLSGHRSCR